MGPRRNMAVFCILKLPRSCRIRAQCREGGKGNSEDRLMAWELVLEVRERASEKLHIDWVSVDSMERGRQASCSAISAAGPQAPSPWCFPSQELGLMCASSARNNSQQWKVPHAQTTEVALCPRDCCGGLVGTETDRSAGSYSGSSIALVVTEETPGLFHHQDAPGVVERTGSRRPSTIYAIGRGAAWTTVLLTVMVVAGIREATAPEGRESALLTA